MLTAEAPSRQAVPFPAAGRPYLVPAVLLALAAVLRLWHIGHGLPDFFEEAIPFRTALRMWGWETGRTDLNPHFFNYPSLAIYGHLLLQKFVYAWGSLTGRFGTPADFWLLCQHDPTLPVLAARLLGVAADLATVLAVYVVGQRLRPGVGVLAGLLVALAPTQIDTARYIYVDPFMTALCLWTLERLTAYLRHGGRHRLAAVIVLTGLAAGTKYNAGLLVVPLAWVLWRRDGWRGLRWWPAAAALSLLVFLASSPYVVLDFYTFWHDFGFERRHMAEGHFGTLDGTGAGFALATAIQNFGVLGNLLLAGAFVVAGYRVRRHADSPQYVLWLFLLPVAVSLAVFKMSAPRYLLPILPVMALLLANLVLRWPERIAWATLRRHNTVRLAITIVLASVIALPVATAGLRIAGVGSRNTRQLARRWLEQHCRADQIILQETYGVQLPNYFDRDTIVDRAPFRAAGTAARQRFLAAPLFRIVSIPMAASGSFTVTVVDEDQQSQRLPVFAHPSQFNRVFYEPALLADVDYFVASGGVQRRYRQDPGRYPVQCSFYAWLEKEATRVQYFAGGDGVAGPSITIYRIDAALQQRIVRQFLPLQPYWWAEAIPYEFRQRFEELLVPADKRTGGAVTKPDGRPAPWLMQLDRPFTRFVMPFLMRLAHFHGQSGHYAACRHLAAVVLAMRPDETPACLLYSRAASELGAFDAALAALRNSVRVLARRNQPTLVLTLEEARVLLAAGDRATARSVLHDLLARAPAGSDIARTADRLLADLRDRDAPAGHDSNGD